MTEADGELLSFAVVGHPNEGKSSVVATLTERDDVRISETPGETQYCADYTVVFEEQALLRFVDTPGFQVPRKTLKWLQAQDVDGDPTGLVAAYGRNYAGREGFDHDHRVLESVVATHGVLYVVDASKPIGPDDLAEMEILRLIGRTRMAVVNSKGENSPHEQEWLNALNRHFNSIRRFNAQQAGFRERIRLLESLRISGQSWEDTLERVVAALKRDWRQRLEETTDLICALVRDCVTYRTSVAWPEGGDRDALEARLTERYAEWIRERENRAHGAIRRLFRHHRFDVEMERCGVKGEDLFSSETWRVLGLKRHQLAAASAIAGAIGGAAVDVALAQITFGVFMAGGAVAGAVGGIAGAKPLAGLTVGVGRVKGQLGGRRLEVGPLRRLQLVFVLVDRALLYFSAMSSRAHARQEHSIGAQAIDSPIRLSRDWERAARDTVSRFASRLAKGKRVDQEEERVRGELLAVIEGDPAVG